MLTKYPDQPTPTVAAPIAQRLRRWSGEPITVALLGLVAVMAGVHVARRPDPPTLVDRADTQRLFARVRELRRVEPMRVMFIAPRILTLETDVPAMGNLYVRDSVLLAELHRGRITHVAVGAFGFPNVLRDSLAAAVARHPDRFRAEVADSGFTLWRVLDDRTGR